jgi:hypothetical protein
VSSVRILVALMAVAATAGPASAGERTSTPTQWRGDVDFVYRGLIEPGAIQDRASREQSFTRVGNYLAQSHQLNITPEFSVFHGISVSLDFPLVFHRSRGWVESFDIRFDPEQNKGTMVASRPLPADVLEGAPASRNHVGFGDLGILFRLVPFAERGVPGREAPATLALDVGIRVPTGDNHDAVRPDGTAGPGRGGAALALGLTASRRVKQMEPYIAIDALLSAPYRFATLDADGVEIPAADGDPGGTEFDPADSIGVRFGAEVVLLEVEETHQRMALDVGFGVRYIGPHEQSVGTWLPAPLDPTVGRLAVEAEHLRIDLGLGFRIRPRQEIEILIDLGGAWATPHTLEMIDKRSYTVQTAPGTFRVFWSVGVRGRIR